MILKGRAPWSNADTAALLRLTADGIDDAQIGKTLGRSADSVRNRRRVLGIQRPNSRAPKMTGAQVREFTRMFLVERRTFADIAAHLGLTESYIEAKAYRLGLVKARDGRAEKRPCLLCDRLFVSEGAHHRICEPCKDTPEWRAGAATYAVGTRDGLAG